MGEINFQIQVLIRDNQDMELIYHQNLQDIKMFSLYLKV